MSDQIRRLEAAREAVHMACDICRAVQSKRERVQALTKNDRSPVTLADFAAQAVIAHTLSRRLGQVTLVAEESAGELRRQVADGHTTLASAVLEAVRPHWPDATLEAVLDAIDLGGAEPARDQFHGFWTLDPIDGTKGFLRGEQYAISLAWIEGDAPTLGVLGCPNLSKDFGFPLDEPDTRGTLYYALAGDGVCEVSADEPHAAPLVIRRLPREPDEPVRLCESVESGHTSHDDAEQVMESLGELAEPLRMDGQGKYAVVARGQADVYLRLPRKSGYVERIWDHAAGALIAAEAGCAVTDAHGKPLDFSRGRGLEANRGIVVAPPGLHGRLMEAIGALGV